jgi:cytochrome P450
MAPTEAAAGGQQPIEDPVWVTRAGLFRTVTGHRQAVAILANEDFRADLAGLFAGVGFPEGPALDIARASLLSVDGVEHRDRRAVVSARFTPRAVEHTREVARAAAELLATDVSGRSTCELISDFATPYVTIGLCHHVGFPEGVGAEVGPAVARLGLATKDLGARREECEAALVELVGVAAREIDRARTAPRDDVLTDLARAVDAGEVDELVAQVLIATLLSAGHEPTTNQIGLGVALLSEHPDVWDALGTGRIDPAAVVEEVLRVRPTNVVVNRRADGPLEVEGVGFRDGELLFVGLAEANRCPHRYPEPDRFAPELDRAPHLSFGLRSHHCLGASLARLQLQEAFVALAATLACPVVERIEEPEGGGLRGVTALELSIRRRAA